MLTRATWQSADRNSISLYIELMATAPQLLTVEEFDKRYGSESGWEYWYGRALRKPVPDKLHALLQRILMQLLNAAGYESGGEFDFKARRTGSLDPPLPFFRKGMNDIQPNYLW
jgi:Uma2 family endonuclease